MAALKDLFVVDAGTFSAPTYFIDSTAKSAFVENFVPGGKREQELKNGVPVWHVTVHIEGYGAIRLSIPAPVQPKFPAFSKVALENLRIGRSTKSFWGLADHIVSEEVTL